MERYEALTLDAERALYGLNGAEVVRCVFEGPADGESALKECKNVHLTDCDLRLRYLKIGVLDVAVILVTLGLVALALWL